VTEILHGIPVTDPYRWLEDQYSPHTRKWLEQQAAYAREYLDPLPGRNRIRQRVEELLAQDIISEPWKVGSRYFYLRRKAHQEQPVIMMREGNFNKEIVLVDPAARGEGTSTAVSILNISRDGNILVYGVKRDGTDSQSIEFLEITHRQILPDRLPDGLRPGLVFSSDKLGFFYAHEIVDAPGTNHRAVYRHNFGEPAEKDSEIFCAGEDANLHVGVFGSGDGKLLGYTVTLLSDPTKFDLYLQDLENSKPPQKIVQRVESLFCPFFVGHRLLALTDQKAPNRRIVAIDPDYPNPDHWSDIVSESQQRIQSFAVAGDFVCVSYHEGNCSRIESVGLTSGRRNTIPCPRRGIVDLIRRPTESDTLFYEFSTFERPPTILSYRPADGEHEVWARTYVPFDPSTIEHEQVRYRSKDGTEVPMFLVAQRGRLAAGPLPTLLTGYGGFGFNHTPQFKSSSIFLIEQGFLFAIANVRGGGELGEEWHCAGKRRNRQNAFDDFISAAEWLVQNRYADPQKIAISGGSNAGLLVGAALTQRPSLFRAVVCSGPLLDMLRYHRFDLANRWTEEYGSSDNPEDFQYLVAYSPYHCVQDGVPYPSVMFVSGDADTRCNPMHARKMAARLQAATSSSHPILLNYKPTWGHMPVQPLSLRIDAVTDRLTFICHELGVSV